MDRLIRSDPPHVALAPRLEMDVRVQVWADGTVFVWEGDPADDAPAMAVRDGETVRFVRDVLIQISGRALRYGMRPFRDPAPERSRR